MCLLECVSILRYLAILKGCRRHELCPKGVSSVPGEQKHIPVSAFGESCKSALMWPVRFGVSNTQHRGETKETKSKIGWLVFGGGRR